MIDKLVIAPGGWSDAVAELLADSKQHATIADLRLQVETGRAQLFEIRDDAGQLVATFILRVDQHAAGAEGVVIAVASRCRGIDMTAAIIPVIERLFINCKTMRIHTARPGMVRKLARLGFEAREMVLAKVIA